VSFTNEDLAHVLFALVALLVAAQVFGNLFARVRLPRVIGEIVGGLVLGPTFLGAVFPGLQERLFPDGTTDTVLAAVYQLGLFLLMFTAGAEIRSVFHRGERRTTSFITASGLLFPFLAGLLLVQVYDLTRFEGSAGHNNAFLLVVAIAFAVTSIPVISKIMFDLGIIATSFARIVLTAAVVEDILLYVALAIALGIAQTEGAQAFGLPSLLDLAPGSDGELVYHVAISIGFFAAALLVLPRTLRKVLSVRGGAIKQTSPIASQLALMITLTATAAVLGITPLLGAFAAGMVASLTTTDKSRARATIKNFSFAFFVPIYFAIVGLQLDLIHHFPLLFFVAFTALACVIKGASVYAGARVAGEARAAATNLAVAMNARGGPGIVLASVAYDANIITQDFYAVLVLLAIVTSLLAGTWLQRVVQTGRPLRGYERASAPGAVVAATRIE
jgi:Kef-type K+ transport system membrane component KefB